MRGALVLLCVLALGSAAVGASDGPTVSGVWRYRRADGTSEVLELVAGGRFVWRDEAGAAAGEMSLADGVLRLRARGAERLFGCRLVDEGLELSAPATDATITMTGDLARMAPRVGAPQVTWRRPGWVPDPPELRVRALADLAGSWRIEPLPGRADRLELTTDGYFTYTGPGGLAASGRASWRSGVLELRADGLTRRLATHLRVSNRGWSLRVRRMPDDQPEPAADLAELPPCLADEAIWRRDLEPPVAAWLVGHHALTDDSGLTHTLIFAADGALTIDRGTRRLAAGTWRLDGQRVVLTVAAESGFDEVRRWSVQRLSGSLVLWRAADDEVGGDRALTADVPPGEGGLARYDTVVAAG